MRTIHLDEHGQRVELRCTPEEGRALDASKVVTATPARHGKDLWLVKAASKVGVAQVGDIEVWIRPKITIERLLFLLGYLVKPKGWRDDLPPFQQADGLVPALAQSLWRQAERALARGLLQGYREHEDTAPVLRGRLRENDQLRKRHGLPMPLEVRYDEFTTDIAENQILRTAIERMLRLPRVDADSRRRLLRLRHRLVDISPVRDGQPLPAWTPSRLNTRYHVALRLAEIIWRSTSVEHGLGSTLANGFLIDMSRVFEDFVTVALSEELRARGGYPRCQVRCHLDTGSRIAMRPDLVYYEHGEPAAVVDAKYKVERPGGFPDEDIYQVLAYCAALGLRRGRLVYAKGSKEPARYTIRNAGIEIICHTLDLDRPPQALLQQITHLTDEITEETARSAA